MKKIFLKNHIKALKYFIFAILFAVISTANSVEMLIDAEVETGIRKLVKPIFESASFQYKDITVYIILDNNINAFVAGGANIFIYTGLITLFNDPDVLKGVIAHELGHIAGGHLVRNGEKIDQLTIPTMATTLLGVAALIAGAPEVGGALISGGTHIANQTYLSHSRSQESAADQAAIKFLHNTHNTVGGLVKLQELFSKEEANISINPYAITHPLSSERLWIMKDALKAEKNKYKTSEEEKKIYSRIVAKLQGFTEPVDSIILSNKKDLNPFARKYELAIANFRQSKLDESIKKLNELIDKEKTNGYLYQLKGQFLFEYGRIEESIKNYQEAIKHLKNDNILLAEYAVILVNSTSSEKNQSIKEKRLREAVKILNVSTSAGIKNPYIYRNLATAYGKLGDYGNSNLMLAEEAILIGKKEDANNFIKRAKKYIKNDSKLKLKLDDLQKTLRNIEAK